MKQEGFQADVVVVGSGGAGLMAALTAQDHGAQTIVLERSPLIGGTTAVSGGGLWIPNNHLMPQLGIADSPDEALEYCLRLSAGATPPHLLATFVHYAPIMARYLEQKTPLRLSVWMSPDYYPHLPGGKAGGRSLEPHPLPKGILGPWAPRLRPAPIFFLPLTLEEMISSRALVGGRLPLDLLVQRMEEGMITMGNALVAGLLKGCLDLGVRFLLDTRALSLLREGHRVTGVRASQHGQEITVRARRAVVLACGGFEWNESLMHSFSSLPIQIPTSPPVNEGDGLLMAMEVGADLGNLYSSWGTPCALVPGEEYEGRPLARLVTGERILPHTILVNRHGRRFVNEASPYHDLNKAFAEFDPTAYGLRNVPCWAIMDAQFRAKYPILTTLPGDPDPHWLVRADSLQELAQKTGIDPQGLRDTVHRWNEFAKAGHDREFGRGQSPYERWVGDPTAPHPNLGTIERPPFYALPLHIASAGTKGGPRTNERGQVLNVRGQPIPGLYAAGNTMASVAGPGYFGGGGTIGLALTWGYLCGLHAAREPLGG